MFAENDLQTNFLLTGGSILLAFIINGGLIIFNAIASKIFPQKAKFADTLGVLLTATPIRIGIEGLLELSLAVML